MTTNHRQTVRIFEGARYDRAYTNFTRIFLDNTIAIVAHETAKPCSLFLKNIVQQIDIIAEVFNPALGKDIALLAALRIVLTAWAEDIEETERLLNFTE